MRVGSVDITSSPSREGGIKAKVAAPKAKMGELALRKTKETQIGNPWRGVRYHSSALGYEYGEGWIFSKKARLG